MIDHRTQLETAEACLNEARRILAGLYADDRPTLQQRRRVSELGSVVQRLRKHLTLNDHRLKPGVVE